MQIFMDLPLPSDILSKDEEQIEDPNHLTDQPPR